MKNLVEAVAEIPWINDKPEYAKAHGLAAELAPDCKRYMEHQQYHDRAIEEGIHKAHKEFGAGLKFCESPIEAVILAGLVFSYYGPKLRIPARVCVPKYLPPDCGVVVFPQFQIANFRLDFLVAGRLRNGRRRWINVECDGHDYHEDVSKRKWDDDRIRDAFMKTMGVQVFRFSGSEIWANPSGCAQEVASTLAEWSAENGER